MRVLYISFVFFFLVGCEKRTSINENQELDYLIIPKCGLLNPSNNSIVSPEVCDLISPIVKDDQAVDWFIDGVKYSSNTHTMFRIDKVNTTEVHEYKMRITNKDGSFFEKVKIINSQPPLSKIDIYALELSIRGIPKFKYDSQLEDSTGRPDIVPMLFNKNNDLIWSPKSYAGNLGDCRDILFELEKPIQNWDIRNPIIIKVFDYDKDQNTFQEITEEGFSQIFNFNNSEYQEGECNQRYPNSIDFNWVGPDDYGCKMGLGSSLKVIWK